MRSPQKLIRADPSLRSNSQHPRIVLCEGDTPGSLPSPGRRKHSFSAGKAGFKGDRDPAHKQTRRMWESEASSGGRCGGPPPAEMGAGNTATKPEGVATCPAREESSSRPEFDSINRHQATASPISLAVFPNRTAPSFRCFDHHAAVSESIYWRNRSLSAGMFRE